jgi:hypothetical protein
MFRVKYKISATPQLLSFQYTQMKETEGVVVWIKTGVNVFSFELVWEKNFVLKKFLKLNSVLGFLWFFCGLNSGVSWFKLKTRF